MAYRVDFQKCGLENLESGKTWDEVAPIFSISRTALELSFVGLIAMDLSHVLKEEVIKLKVPSNRGYRDADYIPQIASLL